MNEINILLGVNSKFVTPLKVLLHSLYKTQTLRCNIFLLNISLSKQEIVNISNLCNFFNMQIKVVPVPLDIVSVLYKKESDLKKLNLSIETYVRLFSPYLLPELDRVLWLDADCLVQRDLSEFYLQDLSNFAIAACDHCNWILPNITEFSKWEYPKRKKTPEHFNAGVILFNLSQCRKIRGFQKDNMVKLILNTNFEFFDQGILNFLLSPNRVKWQDPLKYNCFTNQEWEGGFGRHPIQYELYERASILHYCSRIKPWDLLELQDPIIQRYWIEEYNNVLKIEKNILKG